MTLDGILILVGIIASPFIVLGLIIAFADWSDEAADIEWASRDREP